MVGIRGRDGVSGVYHRGEAMSRVVIGLLAIALVAAPASAQEAPAESPATFTAGVDFVLVDVIVSDVDGPVADLTVDEFEIVEDGEVQAIEVFRVVSVDGTAQAGTGPALPIRSAEDERREAGRDDVRVLVFFLDDYHTQFSNAAIARRALVEFIRSSVGPNDLLAVMGPLTPLEAVRLTRDHDAVIRQIEGFEGRRFRYEPLNAYEESYMYYSAQIIEALRNQVVISALRGLATHLGSVREGRKAIVYVGEGMSATLPPGIRNERAGMDSGVGGLDPSGVAFSQAVFRETDLFDRMRDVHNDANRNNTSIYTVDPQGLGGGTLLADTRMNAGAAQRYFTNARVLLRTMAEETDGRAIVNRNDLAEGLAQVLRDSSVYYLLGYTSPAEPDGEFHEIELRVMRPGVRVRARRGYWAATEADVVRATALPTPRTPEAVENALASIAPPVQALRFVLLWVGFARGDDGLTRVSLVWAPLTPPPGVARELAGQVMVTVTSAGGDLLHRGRSPEAGAGSGSHIVEFEAEPGTIDLDVAIETADGRRIDTEFRQVEVPDLAVGRVAMSTPRVFSARNAREFREVVTDANAVATPVREFRRSERLLIRFDTYGPGAEPPLPAAALLNRSGDRMTELAVAPAQAGGVYQVDLGLGRMAPGTYLVEFTVPGGDAPVLVPLRIGN